MKRDIWPKGIAKEGFLKVETTKASNLSGTQKTALIRKGNELFNEGKYQMAKRIFITTGYSDGLIRIGDYYMEQHDPFEALKMYRLAPAPDRIEQMSEKIARIISNLIKT